MSSVKEACNRLSEKLSPHGPGFRPKWLNGIGVDEREGHERIILYALPVQAAYRDLERLEGIHKDPDWSYWWEDFLVQVTECGPMRML